MPIKSTPPVRKRSANLAQGVVEALTQRIQLGQLKPGEKLPSESTIVLEHGVSRTVVREALSKLQASGLVDALGVPECADLCEPEFCPAPDGEPLPECPE